MSWVNCNRCNGRGSIENVRSYQCNRCHGEGTIARIINTQGYLHGQYFPRNSEIIYETCLQCGGSGDVTHYYQQRCNYCNGQGG